MQNQLKVSVIIPCRNEEKWIGKCIESVLKNDYPHDLLEIFVVDGLSNDKTVEIAKSYRGKYPFVNVLKNEKRIFPAAINLAYNNSKGDVIIILGAHAEYSSNYISDNVKALFEYKVDNVGGLVEQIWPVKNFAGELITIVLSSKFGIGGATYRTGTDKPVLTTTVFGGCYRRDVFERIGLFNEKLISSSDMDFNTRLKKIGGKTLLIPYVKVTYHYAETNYKKFIKNNFRNGFWSVNPIKFVNYIPVSFRHLIPLFFVSGIIGASVLSVFSYYFLWLLILVMGIYVLAAFYFSLKYIKKGFNYFLVLPCFFFSLHFSYGLGSLLALMSVIVFKISGIFKKD
ncbi:MAG TPA: glycosyltransferase family 2 protein [Bacteroidales bacterium]|nr:glycosyltransferase family 2 protein [Bacteroidales bacterium]HPS17090.1 glycosyltransferase family 2 protein [Bacteroidales bacterium]